MRLTGLGKFVILIVALGLAVGGWRLWQGQSTQGNRPGGGGLQFPKVNMPNLGGKNGGKNRGGGGGGARALRATAPAAVACSFLKSTCRISAAKTVARTVVTMAAVQERPPTGTT